MAGKPKMNLHLNVFDNKIPFVTRDRIWRYCTNSTFKLGWQDTDDPSKYELNTHSSWTQKELEDSEIFPYLEDCIRNTDWFTSRKIAKIIVNLVRSDDVHYIHGHHGHVGLNYVNLDWQDGWYGETIFYDPDDITNIAYTSPYTPGRFVLFDGSIPHAIRPQSSKAPKYRFTISIFFEKN